MQRLITIAPALYSFFLIKTNITRLPARIPTHFNAAGNADGWGSSDSLWTLLLVQIMICGLTLAMPFMGQRYPGLVNLGTRRLSDFTPEQRERIMPLITDMMGYMSVLAGLLFAILLRETIQAALSLRPSISLLCVPGFLAGTAVILIYYLKRISATTRETPVTDRHAI